MRRWLPIGVLFAASLATGSSAGAASSDWSIDPSYGVGGALQLTGTGALQFQEISPTGLVVHPYLVGNANTPIYQLGVDGLPIGGPAFTGSAKLWTNVWARDSLNRLYVEGNSQIRMVGTGGPDSEYLGGDAGRDDVVSGTVDGQDGLIVASVRQGNSTKAHGKLLRLTPDGTPDPTFGADGVAATGSFVPQCVVSQADGSMLVSGSDFTRAVKSDGGRYTIGVDAIHVITAQGVDTGAPTPALNTLHDASGTTAFSTATTTTGDANGAPICDRLADGTSRFFVGGPGEWIAIDVARDYTITHTTTTHEYSRIDPLPDGGFATTEQYNNLGGRQDSITVRHYDSAFHLMSRHEVGVSEEFIFRWHGPEQRRAPRRNGDLSGDRGVQGRAPRAGPFDPRKHARTQRPGS